MVTPMSVEARVTTMLAKKAVRVPQMVPYQMSYWPLVVPQRWTHSVLPVTGVYQNGMVDGAFLVHGLPGGCGSARKPSRGICIGL